MQALRRSGHSAVAVPSISRGISDTPLKRDLLRPSRLLWHIRHAMFSKTAHSLLSRGLRSSFPKSRFLALMKARRFLRSHSLVVLAFWTGTESSWKTNSWPHGFPWHPTLRWCCDRREQTALSQVSEETVVQKKPSLQPCNLTVSSFGQIESCSTTYDRTM